MFTYVTYFLGASLGALVRCDEARVVHAGVEGGVEEARVLGALALQDVRRHAVAVVPARAHNHACLANILVLAGNAPLPATAVLAGTRSLLG